MNGEYYDEQEIRNYSELYEQTMRKINNLARSPSLQENNSEKSNSLNPIE